jgi:hypothetical protein
MNARATLSNGRIVKENGGGTVRIYFFGPLYIYSDGADLLSGSSRASWFQTLGFQRTIQVPLPRIIQMFPPLIYRFS